MGKKTKSIREDKILKSTEDKKIISNNIVDLFLENDDFVGNDEIETVYVHVGMPKTATSSIQKMSFLKKDYLNDKHVLLYPVHKNMNNGIGIRSIICNEPEKFNFHYENRHSTDEISKYQKEVLDLYVNDIINTNSKKILFSGEPIMISNINELNRLKSLLNRLAPKANIKIVICVRDVSGFFTSAYQQILKMGYGFDRYEGVYNKGLYKNRISKFIDLFGKENCIIFKFEDAVASGDVTKYFFRKLDVKDNILSDKSISRANESVSDKACDLLKYINSKYPFVKTKTMKVNIGRYSQDTFAIESISGGKFNLDHEIEKIYNDEFDIDLAYLESIGISYPKRDFKKKTVLQFDEIYYDEFITAYEKVSVILKVLMKDYVNYKISDTELNKYSVAVLGRIKKYIEEN